MKKLVFSILTWILFFVLCALGVEFIEAEHLYISMSYVALIISISRLVYLRLSFKLDPVIMEISEGKYKEDEEYRQKILTALSEEKYKEDVKLYQQIAVFSSIIFVSILALLSLNIREPFMSILSISIYFLAIFVMYKKIFLD